MWNLLKREDQECRRLRDAIEAAAMKSADAVSVESKSLTELLAAHHRKHLETCADCRNAVQDLVAMKELFRGAVRFRQEERPWFAARVMAAIASRESKLAERVSAWTEFPRFASRLTWITAVLLLVGTTWFYESVLRAPSYPASGSQESIFEAPPQTPPDDILVSWASDNR